MTKAKKRETVTVRIRHEQNMFGRTSGEDGMSSYHWRGFDGDEWNQCTGVALDTLLGVPLLHGAELDVTVTLVKQGKRKKNPWLDVVRRRR